jgi:hypothetical protein
METVSFSSEINQIFLLNYILVPIIEYSGPPDWIGVTFRL